MSEIEEQFYTALRQLERSYSENENTTWAECCTVGCTDAAPGGDECANCCEIKLADIIGSRDHASLVHIAINRRSEAVSLALNIINDQERNHDKRY